MGRAAGDYDYAVPPLTQLAVTGRILLITEEAGWEGGKGDDQLVGVGGGEEGRKDWELFLGW